MAGILPSGRHRPARYGAAMSTPLARTFPELLAARLRTDPAQPLVTAYDDATGERTELSVTTYANWVSKTANLFIDELGLDPGDTVLLDLPSHWLVPVFLGAAWSAGLAVTTDLDLSPDVVVCGPDGLDRHRDARPGGRLRAAAVRGALRRSAARQACSTTGCSGPGRATSSHRSSRRAPTRVAWLAADEALTHAGLLEEAGSSDLEPGARLLTDVHPAEDHGVPVFLGTTRCAGGSLVLLALTGGDDVARPPARTSGPRS